jgi:ribosome biogenesis GTPase
VRSGALPSDRLESYNKLLRELRFQELKQDKRARAEERRRWRVLNTSMRRTTRPPKQ